MIEIQPEQARTLATILDEGTFEAAAQKLNVTASAVSQRMRALEIAVGRPVLQRVRPIKLTISGEAVVRFARQLDLLAAELVGALETNVETGAGPRISIVVNGDSLNTWVLPALVRASEALQLEILREDQEHSLDLLRNGSAAAAITDTSLPVPGCSVRRLGTMRYRPVCTPAFASRWLGKGLSSEALAAAPVVMYDHKDDLQARYLRRHSRRPLHPPRHYVPGTHEFGRAITLGLGWGMLPELQIGEGLALGELVTLADAHLDVPLYWQQWRLSSTALEQVSAAVQQAAKASLR